MPQTLRYDLILLIDASAEEATRQKILADTEQLLASKGASIASKHGWGTRKTAYEIAKKTDAEYHLLTFEGEPTVPAELDRVLSITDGVTRHRVLKVEKDAPKPGELRQEAVAEAESAPAEAAPQRL